MATLYPAALATLPIATSACKESPATEPKPIATLCSEVDDEFWPIATPPFAVTLRPIATAPS